MQWQAALPVLGVALTLGATVSAGPGREKLQLNSADQEAGSL